LSKQREEKAAAVELIKESLQNAQGSILTDYRGLTDPVAPAKIISEFAKSHKALEIKAGILEGTVIPLEKVKALADLPSKEQLLGQVAAVMQAPIVNLVNVLQAPIRNLAYAVDALREKREQEA